MKLKNRHHLRSDEIEELKNHSKNQFGENFKDDLFPPDCKVEIAEIEDLFIVYITDGEFILFEMDGVLIPSLKAILNNKLDLPKVVVDTGAIKFVVNGADIMRPGIVQIDDDIEKGSYIKIVDENYNKALAIGKSLYNSDVMKKMEKGRVIKNIHHINDKIWNFLEER
ncbi:MAG: RNA-binding protein [Candidatus Lokiarchaeota archaeon]|nr:RNA-binding protein [Candidatus Lokiarchaeota archaeon]